MTLVFTDGIPGLEGLFEWTTAHRSALTAVLNDYDATPWRAILDPEEGVGGLHGKADLEDLRSKKQGRTGELLGPASKSGKTRTFPVILQAKSKTELRRGEMVLESAFEDDNEGRMRIRLLWEDEDDYWWFDGRVLSFDFIEKQQQDDEAVWPYQRAAQLGIRSSDPLRYWSHPISGGPNATQVTVANPGTRVDPQITVETDGGADVNIRNTTLGLNLKIADPGAGVLTYDFARRIIWRNDPGDEPFVDGEAVTRRLLTAQSTWWNPGMPGIDRGSNQINLTAGGTSIAVAFFPGL